MNRKQCPGVAIRVLGLFIAILALSAAASAEWKEKVLYSFQGSPDAATPAGGVVFDKDGNLYGAALGGPDGTQGTVFQLSPPVKKGGSWKEQVLYAFQGKTRNDGQIPSGGLIVDGAGNLYGVTAYGGTGGCLLLGTSVGCGTVYEMSPPKQKGGKWTETVLYSFQGGNDGYYPSGTLLFDGAGSLYGATLFGGGFGTCDQNIYPYCGTVFKLSPTKKQTAAWTEKVLHSFKSGTDGANPNGGLVLDSKGAVYGTTYSGGNQDCNYGSSVGCGTAFKVAPPKKKRGAWIERELYVFTGGTDGGQPNGELIFNAEGSLYGTAGGGSSSGGGIAFKLTATKGGRWNEAVLQWFSNNGPGAFTTGLTSDSSGNLYGPTNEGARFRGTLVRLKRPARRDGKWVPTVLYTFQGSPDGANPAGQLIFDKAGAIYGTTQYGGTGQVCQGGCGTVFEVSP